ncbi:MAG: RNA polymerase sigma factor [Ignavibacteriae bacterium]|nr:RNA polymerase sigma factor [Ignavibacteria bacterium]MBI3364053.1 RNA polymerase sigma factor [Ignavibacteriota bacterium]
MAPNDLQLIQSAQQGDVIAFEQLVHRYDKHVLAIAARFGNSSEDAKDIYQEVFLRVYRGLKNFQLKSEFTTWLYRITTNVCLTYQSQKKKDRQHTSLDDGGGHENASQETMTHVRALDPSPDQQTEATEISFHVQKALNVLSPQQKLVFTLRHYQGYKLKEIAGMMDCTEGTVKRYLFTGTQRMREQLKDVYGM